MFFIYGSLAELLAVFVNWGFMMALLFNLVSYSDAKARKRSPVLISLTISISYLSTSFLDIGYYVYAVYPIADVLTIFIIYWIQKRREITAALYYCIFGLALNAILHSAMYLDIVIHGNREPWWLWSVYSIGININDVMMILALIVNRDFLGLRLLAKHIK
ncbi:hypothetical protein [Pseudoalteromonas sp. GB56]